MTDLQRVTENYAAMRILVASEAARSDLVVASRPSLFTTMARIRRVTSPELTHAA